jgi:hypothetical protein
MSTVLVAGTSSPFDRLARRYALMVASTLIEYGFNLLTGNATGVDKSVASAFFFELARRKEDPGQRYQQLRLPWILRGSRWPLPGFRAPKHLRVPLDRMHDWLEEARARADAAIMIGGHEGAQRIADRFMDAGKPVFPVPFTGGCANDVFREILRNWCENPVPGLTKNQFLRLAIPWIAGTGALADLLLGTLSPTPDIFISYRRADSEWITGRLRADLAEHFGTKRVFMDLEHIAPSQSWPDVIAAAIKASRVGIIIIGGRWFAEGESGRPRLLDTTDVLRNEILDLLSDHTRTIIIVLTPDAPPPHRWELPDEFARLAKTQAVTISSATWDMVRDQIVRTIRPVLRGPARVLTPDPAVTVLPVAPEPALGAPGRLRT